jgi:2-oxoglutarate dehydrogenase E1 component
MRLADIIAALKETYTRTLGTEYMYISDTATKALLPAAAGADPRHAELFAGRAPPHPGAPYRAETLERYLHTKYVGQKRFSGEGGLDDDPDARPAHRERRARPACRKSCWAWRIAALDNVLVNTLGKIPADLFSEFEGKTMQDLPAGDVKYHQGFSSDVSTPGGPCI